MTHNCQESRPVIFIICDQLCAIHTLPSDVRKHFEGYKKWSRQCINLLEHYVTSIPCSPSRASIYTGKNSNVTQMTDNNNNAWQNDLLTEAEGLKTLGTYFRAKHYKTRYMGKFHLSKNLDPNAVLKFKPTIATQDYLKSYGFDIYDKDGDAGFDHSGGFFTDVDLLQKRLPNGNDPKKCDFYDKQNDVAFDGVFPFLMKRHECQDNKFLLVVNFRNPHDITYNDTIPIEENPTSQTPTLQFAGNPKEINQTNSSYNKNYRLFYKTPLVNEKSIVYDNPLNSKTNNDPLYISIVYYFATQYYGYGISIDNLLSYKYYQTTYLQMLKQLDTQLEQLFDFLTDFGYFDSAVIILGSDHGEMNGSHGLVQKATMIYKTAWNVTTFISFPGMRSSYKGYQNKRITSNIQLTPTAMLLSNTYSEHEIKKLGLFPPMFKECGNSFRLSRKNFTNLKLNFSLGYGPVFLPLLVSLQNDTINALLDKYLPIGINYFTLPALSVSADIIYKEKHYNVGYYFSLLNLFITNYKNIDLSVVIPPSPVPFIMTNSISTGGIAFVGTPLQIYQQFFGNVYFVNQYFQNVKIEPFIPPLTTQYHPLLLPPTIYGTAIYSNSNLFDEATVTEFINSLVPGGVIPPAVTLYDSGVTTGGTPGGIYCYYGNKAYIQFLLQTDPLISSWVSPTIVNGTLPQYSVYVMNDPIYQNAQIYTKVGVDKTAVVAIFNLINYIKTLFSLPPTQLTAIILGNINYSVFDSLQFIFSAALQSLSSFTLPGQNMTVQQLLTSGYQVQVFNDTKDKQELYNLADSSRIVANVNLINKLFVKLNKHIVYNNCQNIFISLPVRLLFTQILENIKSFNQTDVPMIYNYSLLEANYYNQTKG